MAVKKSKPEASAIEGVAEEVRREEGGGSEGEERGQGAGRRQRHGLEGRNPQAGRGGQGAGRQEGVGPQEGRGPGQADRPPARIPQADPGQAG